MMTNISSSQQNFRWNSKLFLFARIFYFSSVYECYILENSSIILDFRDEGILQREPDKLGWSDFMMTRIENFEKFRSPGIIKLGKFIKKKNFELLEKVINGDLMNINISLPKTLFILTFVEPFMISKEYRSSFMQNLYKAVLSFENTFIIEAEEEILVEKRMLCIFIVALLKCLCQDCRIPLFIHYEEGLTEIYITEDTPDINRAEISDIWVQNLREIHLHISLSFLHFLTKGTWSTYTSTKLFRTIYGCNEITKRTIVFEHAEYNSPFWCYENLFNNIVIDTFKMRINKVNVEEISSLHDCFRKHLRIINLCVYTKDYHDLFIEKICNFEFLKTLEICLECSGYYLPISFSEYTFKRCIIFTAKRIRFTKNLYDTLLYMTNLKTLNLHGFISSDTDLITKLCKHKEILNILNIVDLGDDHSTIFYFLDNIQKHMHCSIKLLSIGGYFGETLSHSLLCLLRTDSVKKSLKTIELKIYKLKNSLCNAILECNQLENLILMIGNCSESLTRIGLVDCAISLKSVHLYIWACSPEFTCSIFDSFLNIKRFELEIRFSNEIVNFCNNSNSLIGKISALKIEYPNSNIYDLKWLGFALNITELNLNCGNGSYLKNNTKIFTLQPFVERLKRLILYGSGTPTNKKDELPELVKKCQRLEILDWRNVIYNIDYSSLFLQNEATKTLKDMKLCLSEGDNFFTSLKNPFECLGTLKITISRGFIFNENIDNIKNCFPALERLNIVDYEYEQEFFEFKIPIVRTFNFINGICFENKYLTLAKVSDFILLIKEETQRSAVIKIIGNPNNYEDFIIFRDEFKA